MKMSRICRLCMKETLVFLSIHDTDEEGVAVSSLIKSLIPEVYQGLIQNPVICTVCLQSLQSANNFRIVCLRSENLIAKFIRETKYTENTLNLEMVIDYWLRLSESGESSYNNRAIKKWFGKSKEDDDVSKKPTQQESPKKRNQEAEPSLAPKKQPFQIRVKPVSALQDVHFLDDELFPEPNVTNVENNNLPDTVLKSRNEITSLKQTSNSPDRVFLNGRLFLKCLKPKIVPVIKKVLGKSIQKGKAISYTVLKDDSMLVEINDSNVYTKMEKSANNNCDNIQKNKNGEILTDIVSKNNTTCDHKEIKNEPLFCYEEIITSEKPKTGTSVINSADSEATDSADESDFLTFLANEVKNNIGDDDHFDLPEYVDIVTVNSKRLPNILRKYSWADEIQMKNDRRPVTNIKKPLRIVPVGEPEVGQRFRCKYKRLLLQTESKDDSRNVCVLQTSFTSDGDYVNDHDYLIGPYARNKILKHGGKRTSCYCALCDKYNLVQYHVNHMNQHETICPICTIDFCNVFVLNLHIKCEHATFCTECSITIPYKKMAQHLLHHKISLEPTNEWFTDKFIIQTQATENQNESSIIMYNETAANQVAERGRKRPRKQQFGLNSIKRKRKEYKLPENRNLETIKSTETANFNNNSDDNFESLARRNFEFHCLPSAFAPLASSANLADSLRNEDAFSNGETPNLVYSLSPNGPKEDPLTLPDPLVVPEKSKRRKGSRKAYFRNYNKLRQNIRNLTENSIKSETAKVSLALDLPSEGPKYDPLSLPVEDPLVMPKKPKRKRSRKAYFRSYAKLRRNNSKAATICSMPDVRSENREHDSLALSDKGPFGLSTTPILKKSDMALLRCFRNLKQFKAKDNSNTSEDHNSEAAKMSSVSSSVLDLPPEGTDQEPLLLSHESLPMPLRRSRRKRNIKRKSVLITPR